MEIRWSNSARRHELALTPSRITSPNSVTSSRYFNKISNPINFKTVRNSLSTLFGGALWGCPVFPARNRQLPQNLSKCFIRFPDFPEKSGGDSITLLPTRGRKVVNDVSLYFLSLNFFILSLSQALKTLFTILFSSCFHLKIGVGIA